MQIFLIHLLKCTRIFTYAYIWTYARTHTHAYIQVLEGRLKKGEPCIIVFPKLHPHKEAKAYVMPYDKPEEITDTDDDEQTLMNLEEDDGSTVGGGGGKGRDEAGGASDDGVGRGASTENR